MVGIKMMLVPLPTVCNCNRYDCGDISEETAFCHPHFLQFQIKLPALVPNIHHIWMLKVFCDYIWTRYITCTSVVELILPLRLVANSLLRVSCISCRKEAQNFSFVVFVPYSDHSFACRCQCEFERLIAATAFSSRQARDRWRESIDWFVFCACAHQCLRRLCWSRSHIFLNRRVPCQRLNRQVQDRQ